jgi:hypothetical protein
VRKSPQFSTPVPQANDYESWNGFNDSIAGGVPTLLALKISAKRMVCEAKEEPVEIHSGSMGKRGWNLSSKGFHRENLWKRDHTASQAGIPRK